MAKAAIDYDAFCAGVEKAVEALNDKLSFDGRYVIAQVEDGGFFHVLLCRPTGDPRPVFELANGLKTAFYPDMQEHEFNALAAHFLSGKTQKEDFDAVPLHVLYEVFCQAP